MFRKIHNIYICLGRPNKYDYRFYITNILHITITGMSWKIFGFNKIN
jgi:hypothetical protein